MLQWISDEGTPLTVLDKLTYAGNLSNLEKVSVGSTLSACPG